MYLMNRTDWVPTGTLIEYLTERKDSCVLLCKPECSGDTESEQWISTAPIPSVAYRKILQGGM